MQLRFLTGSRRLIIVAGAAGSALLLLPANPVSAAAASTHTTNFAGYIASVTNSATQFSGSISIPAVTCPASGSTTLAPTADIRTTNNFIQFENQISCANGTATNNGFLAGIYPSTGGTPIADAFIQTAAGDTVKATLTISAGTGTVKVSDLTAHSSGSAAAPVSGSLTSVQIGTFVFSSPTVVPNFTTITYGTVKIGPAALSTFSPAQYEIFNGTVN